METHLFQSISCINLKTYFNLVFIQDNKYLKKYIIRIVFWILYRIKYLEKQYFCNFRSHDFLSVFFTTFSPVNFSVFLCRFSYFLWIFPSSLFFIIFATKRRVKFHWKCFLLFPKTLPLDHPWTADTLIPDPTLSTTPLSSVNKNGKRRNKWNSLHA